MRWWNDLWLNEGFATMMGQKAADFIENTTLRMSQYFAADITLKAMSSDQHTTMTQPISLKENSDRLHGQDVKILYNKGAAVIRMVESTIGEQVFRQGLNLYLLEYAYSNAEKNDFLSSFSKIFKAIDHHHDPFLSTNFSVSDFIDSWIYQRGFPLLEVRKIGKNYVEVTQKIFDVDNNPKFADSQWKVPVFVRKDGRDELYWLEEGRKLILLRDPQSLVLDSKFLGYYRIHYELDHWNILVNHLLHNHNYFSVSTRIKLLDDAFVLAENGRVPYSLAMEMSVYLRNEVEVVPFITFLARFESILYRAYRHPNAWLFSKYVQFLMEPSFERIIKTKENPNVPHTMEFEFVRELVFLKMCANGYQRCIDIFRQKVDELHKNCSREIFSSPCNQLEASLRNVAYMVASKYGNQSDLAFLAEKFRAEEYHMERDRLFSALATTSNLSYIKVLTEDVLTVKERDTDFRPKLYELSRKNYDNGVVEQYIYNNFADLFERHKKYGPFFMLQMARGYGSEEDLMKLELFEKKYSALLTKLQPVLAHIRKDITRKMIWSAKNANQIIEFISIRLQDWHGVSVV